MNTQCWDEAIERAEIMVTQINQKREDLVRLLQILSLKGTNLLEEMKTPEDLTHKERLKRLDQILDWLWVAESLMSAFRYELMV